MRGTKRKREVGPELRPVLYATNPDLGDSVEFRIRDNGIGSAPKSKGQDVHPFLRPAAGEGNGLALESHDIMLKQHGGTIDVDNEPGEYQNSGSC